MVVLVTHGQGECLVVKELRLGLIDLNRNRELLQGGFPVLTEQIVESQLEVGTGVIFPELAGFDEVFSGGIQLLNLPVADTPFHQCFELFTMLQKF